MLAEAGFVMWKGGEWSGDKSDGGYILTPPCLERKCRRVRRKIKEKREMKDTEMEMERSGGEWSKGEVDTY